MDKLRIRMPLLSDAEPISALIVSLADAFVVPGADPSAFLESVSPKAEAEYLSNPRFWYRIAEVDRAFAGVIAIRDYNHLTHLFVSPELQHGGIGRALWQAAIEMFEQHETTGVTVFAAPDAVPFYRKLGFVPTEEERVSNGVRVLPMRVELEPALRNNHATA